jgi:hypothetical protein
VRDALCVADRSRSKELQLHPASASRHLRITVTYEATKSEAYIVSVLRIHNVN